MNHKKNLHAENLQNCKYPNEMDMGVGLNIAMFLKQIKVMMLCRVK